MTLAAFNKLSRTFDLVQSVPGCYFTLDAANKLTATQKADCQIASSRVVDCLIFELAAFAIRPEISEVRSGDLLSSLKKKALTLLESKTSTIPKQCPQFYALKNFYFPVAKALYKLHKAYAKAPQKAIPVKNDSDHSIRAEKLLKMAPVKPKTSDFQLISCPRDLLFIEKKALHHIKRFVLVQQAIAQRVNGWLERGLNVVYIGQANAPQGIFFDSKEAGILELGLVMQIQRACLRIIKDSEDPSLDDVLRKLVAYKKQEDGKEQFYNDCIEILETNELLSLNERLFAGWRKIEFAAEALLDGESVKHHFELRSYLPRKRLRFLRTTGLKLFPAICKLSKNSVDVRFARQAHIAAVYLDILKNFEAKIDYPSDTACYAELTAWISTALKTSKNKVDNHQRFDQMYFNNEDEFPYGEDGFEWYEFKITDAVKYEKVVKKIQALGGKLPLKMPKLVEKFESANPDSDKGWLADLPVSKPRVIKQPGKKKRTTTQTPGSASRSPSPESSTSPASPIKPSVVDELVQNLATLQLEQKSASVTTKTQGKAAPIKALEVQKITPKTPTPVALAASKITSNQYPWKTRRWWEPQSSPLHPFRCDTKYMSQKLYDDPIAGFWVSFEHNFALAVDNYLYEGSRTTDKKLLAEHDVIERIQLFGEVQVTTEAGIKVRTVVFTYGRGRHRRFVHRSCTRLDREDIINGNYIEHGWKILAQAAAELREAAKLKAAAAEPEAAVLGTDGSELESITENLITIKDPKNRARIILVRMKE